MSALADRARTSLNMAVGSPLNRFGCLTLGHQTHTTADPALIYSPGATVAAKLGGGILSPANGVTVVDHFRRRVIQPLIGLATDHPTSHQIVVVSAIGRLPGETAKLTDKLIYMWKEYANFINREQCDEEIALEILQLLARHRLSTATAVAAFGEIATVILFSQLLFEMADGEGPASDFRTVLPPIRADPEKAIAACGDIFKFVAAHCLLDQGIDVDRIEHFLRTQSANHIICDEAHWPVFIDGQGHLHAKPAALKAFGRVAGRHHIMLAPGFLGVDDDDIVVVGGRGASDASVHVFGGVADSIVIAKDTKALTTSDPDVYSCAMPLDKVTFSMVGTGTFNGAVVVSDTALPLMEHALKLGTRVLVTGWPPAGGTEIIYGSWDKEERVRTDTVSVLKVHPRDSAADYTDLLFKLTSRLAGEPGEPINIRHLAIGFCGFRLDFANEVFASAVQRLGEFGELANFNLVPGLGSVYVSFGVRGFDPEMLMDAMAEAEKQGVTFRRILVIGNEIVFIVDDGKEEKQAQRLLDEISKNYHDKPLKSRGVMDEYIPYTGVSVFSGLSIDGLSVGNHPIQGYAFYGDELSTKPGVFAKLTGRLNEKGIPLLMTVGGTRVNVLCFPVDTPADPGEILVGVANDYLDEGVHFRVDPLDSGNLELFNATGDFAMSKGKGLFALADILADHNIPVRALIVTTEEMTVVVHKEHAASMRAAFGIGQN